MPLDKHLKIKRPTLYMQQPQCEAQLKKNVLLSHSNTFLNLNLYTVDEMTGPTVCVFYSEVSLNITVD